MYKFIPVICFILQANVSWAQKNFVFTRGLMVNGMHHYGREALYSDSLAYQLYTQKLRAPAAGNDLWKEVLADSANIFKTRQFGMGGYLYLTYTSTKKQQVLLNIKGNSALFVNGVLHAGDPYGSGWLYIPVELRKGLNEFYVRTYYQTSATIIFPEKPVMLNTADATLPYIVLSRQGGKLQGAVVLINSGTKALQGYRLTCDLAGKTTETALPAIPAMSTRKVIFNIDAGNVTRTGITGCALTLLQDKKVIDQKSVSLESVDSNARYSNTFVSKIDGSLQYYSVTPQVNGAKDNAALFLSVHGAGVEAIGQAKAYQPKDWGTLVAATNRRPRGFNWEDWGRLDALEVLALAKEHFKPDPQRIYLTGHSMGGHGTWFLGATYPGTWAGIAPCAGYPTLKEYGSADGKIPESSTDPFEKMMLRSGNQSDVINLATNYKPLGVYVFHGDSDKVVSVNYARQMKKVLSAFHPDFSYYEYPGGSHWFGDHSVDWKPLFDFFKWHKRLPDSAVNDLDFTTASPGISSDYRWASVIQQVHPLTYSHIRLQRDLTGNTILGTTANVQLLRLALDGFTPKVPVTITLDSTGPVRYTVQTAHDSIYISKNSGSWKLVQAPGAAQKGPSRYGTFKEAFNNHMVLVYGTRGNPEENAWAMDKARFDAESWYYRGNGAVDIIPDTEYSLSGYTDRGVVLYGNKNTNAAWSALLAECPVQVERNRVTVGNKSWTGDDLAGYFTWPLHNSKIASVAVVGGSGLKGMNAANANQYFAGGSGFPDFMIFRLAMLVSGAKEIQAAGFFDNEWKLADEEYITQ